MTAGVVLLSILTLLNAGMTFANWRMTRRNGIGHSHDDLMIQMQLLAESHLRLTDKQDRFSMSITNLHQRIDRSLDELVKRLGPGC